MGLHRVGGSVMIDMNMQYYAKLFAQSPRKGGRRRGVYGPARLAALQSPLRQEGMDRWHGRIGENMRRNLSPILVATIFS